MYKQIQYNQLFFFIGMLAGLGSFAQNVGIGSTQFVPSATLEIRGLSVLSTDYALKARDNASSDLLVVQNNGNVGIGVSSPLHKFVVNGNAQIQGHGSVGVAGTPAPTTTLLVHDLFAGGVSAVGIHCQPIFQDFFTPLTDLYGIYVIPIATIGTVSNITGIKSIPNIGNGTVTNTYCYYSQNPIKVGGSTTNAYGMYIENITSGTTNYAIYAAGGKNYFAGNVGIGSSSPNSSLNVNGSFATTITTKIANYTITASDYTVLANATAGGFTITLPTAVGIAARIIVIKKTDATANVVAVTTTSAQTIDGAAPPLNIAVPNDRITVQSDGANWVRID